MEKGCSVKVKFDQGDGLEEYGQQFRHQTGIHRCAINFFALWEMGGGREGGERDPDSDSNIFIHFYFSKYQLYKHNSNITKKRRKIKGY